MRGGLNLYSYAEGDPVLRFDPLGLATPDMPMPVPRPAPPPPPPAMPRIPPAPMPPPAPPVPSVPKGPTLPRVPTVPKVPGGAAGLIITYIVSQLLDPPVVCAPGPEWETEYEKQKKKRKTCYEDCDLLYSNSFQRWLCKVDCDNENPLPPVM